MVVKRFAIILDDTQTHQSTSYDAFNQADGFGVSDIFGFAIAELDVRNRLLIIDIHRCLVGITMEQSQCIRTGSAPILPTVVSIKVERLRFRPAVGSIVDTFDGDSDGLDDFAGQLIAHTAIIKVDETHVIAPLLAAPCAVSSASAAGPTGCSPGSIDPFTLIDVVCWIPAVFVIGSVSVVVAIIVVCLENVRPGAVVIHRM